MSIARRETGCGRWRSLGPPEVRVPPAFEGGVGRRVFTASKPRPSKTAGFFRASIGWRKRSTKRWKAYRFHEAAHVVYHFFWGEYCDWYLELIKPRLMAEDREPGPHGLRKSDQHLRRGIADAVTVHALHHRRTLARGIRWQAAGEVDRAGRLSPSATRRRWTRPPKPRWRSCRT